jgi:hypothetical protein
VAQARKSVVLGISAFVSGLAVAQLLHQGAVLPRLAAYAPEIWAEGGPEGSVVIHTSTPGKRYVVVVDPTVLQRRQAGFYPRERPREGYAPISLHSELVTVPSHEVAATRVFELVQVMRCDGPDPLCKICEPGSPHDACTNPPDPLPQPSGVFPPEGYGLHLLNGPRP